jgi:hypothetical protein
MERENSHLKIRKGFRWWDESDTLKIGIIPNEVKIINDEISNTWV